MVAWIVAILLGVSIGIVIDRACEWLSDHPAENDDDVKSEINSKYGYIDTDMFNEFRNITDKSITYMYPEIKKKENDNNES